VPGSTTTPFSLTERLRDSHFSLPFVRDCPLRSMGRLAGLATPEGTGQFRARGVDKRRLPPSHFREAPGGLSVSSLGLGTYIGPPDAETDLAVEHSVAICLTSGRVNVLDTAINYRYQRAERSIGRALTRLSEKGEVERDEVFLATKSGYIAPDAESRTPADQWVRQELIGPGVLKPSEIVDNSHAMTPRYLADQFERSRNNLGVDAIDLLYLHNGPDAQLPIVGREEFERRLEAAFAYYEGLRNEGTLGAYGMATWDCLRVPRGDPGYFSLASAVRIARKVGGEGHGFRFIQFPFNLAMTEAAVVHNQFVADERMTLFDAADRVGVACFTSVPLLQGQLAKGGPKRRGLSPAQTALQFARSAPGTLGPVIGQKSSEHLSENLEVASVPPWDAAGFAEVMT
jgi:aryl-alcohol dehydrogenase-like predicted oxidoreductase